MPRKITGAKIACLDFPLQKTKMQWAAGRAGQPPEILKKCRFLERKTEFLSKILNFSIIFEQKVYHFSKKIENFSRDLLLPPW